VVIITGALVKIKNLGGHAMSAGKAIATSEERSGVKWSSILQPLYTDDGDSKGVSRIYRAFTEIKLPYEE